jgi:hypothetical protein
VVRGNGASRFAGALITAAVGVTKEYISILSFRLALPLPLKGSGRCTGMYECRERQDAVSGQGGGSVIKLFY